MAAPGTDLPVDPPLRHILTRGTLPKLLPTAEANELRSRELDPQLTQDAKGKLKLHTSTSIVANAAFAAVENKVSASGVEKLASLRRADDHKLVHAGSLFPSAEEAAEMKEFALTTPDKPDHPRHYDREKIIGLYFTASWCPPCMRLTPQLKRMYASVKEDQQKDFEMVTLSWDNDQAQYEDYVNGMPWAALPYKDDRIDELNRAYAVSSIPRLVLVRARDGKVINNNAQDYVPMDVLGRVYPWPSMKTGWAYTFQALTVFGIAGIVSTMLLRDFRWIKPKV